GDRLHLAPDRHPLDAPALSLRPAHAARVAGLAAALARQRDDLGTGRAARGAGRVSALIFLLLAALVLAAALTVVVHPSPVYSACALVVTLFLLSVFFVALDAQLVAVLQVIVYAGAIVVLFIFVIMLLNLTQTELRPTAGAPLVAAIGVLIRRNVIVIFMAIELMLNAVNLTFVALARSLGSMDGQVIVFFVMTVAAAEAAVGLAIIIALFRNGETMNADELVTLRW